MLRVAVPTKGGLAEPAMTLLEDAGYDARKSGKDLFRPNPNAGVEFVFLRPDDIAAQLADGVLDAGITGQDLLAEVGASYDERLPLGFGESQFFFAVPNESATARIEDLHGRKVATSFPEMTRRAAEAWGITVHPVEMSGSVESAAQLGVSDAIADVVETGSSLRAAGMRTVGSALFTSQAVLACPPGPSTEEKQTGLQRLTRRVESALTARQYVMVEYNCPAPVLDVAKKVTPGVESPTVAPLSEDGWFSVRAMVRKGTEQDVLDELYDAGARAVLVTPVQAVRM